MMSRLEHGRVAVIVILRTLIVGATIGLAQIGGQECGTASGVDNARDRRLGHKLAIEYIVTSLLGLQLLQVLVEKLWIGVKPSAHLACIQLA